MKHSFAFVVAAGIAVLIGADTAVAQPRVGSAPPAGPDMSGLWLVQDPGSGSWSAWFNNVPKPALRPDIIKDNVAIEASEAAGNVVNTMPRRPDCPVGNLPMMMASSPPLNIVAARDEVLIAAESGRGRFIYTDGRPHPDTKAPSYVASGFGHSIGRWEADTLIVDTVGFPARVCDSRRPVMLVPGGGRAKDSTHLVERFRLVDRDTLSVTFTWDDSTVFLEPHSYSYTYKRVAEGIPIENNDEGPAPAAPEKVEK
jgi:hypothetical protein